MTATAKANPNYLMEFDMQRDRAAWANAMRLEFSPQGCAKADGSLNQEYFKPQKVILIHSEGKKWGEAEADLLCQGIAKHGIGNWRAIRTEFLNNWEENKLSTKARVLIGSQNLERYKGWKGDRKAIEAVRAQNEELGRRLKCWKNGQLIDDDQQTLANYFRALDAANGQAKA